MVYTVQTTNKKKQLVALAILAMVFNAAILVSDVLTYKVTTLWGITMSLSLFIYPVSYVVSDIITECYGRFIAISIMLASMAIELLSDYSISLFSIVPNTDSHVYQNAFSIALGGLGRVALGGLVAAACGYLINVLTMSALKSKFKPFVVRSVISTLAGETVFLAVGYTIWYWSTSLSTETITQMVLFSIVFKMIFACIYSVPGNYLSVWIKNN